MQLEARKSDFYLRIVCHVLLAAMKVAVFFPFWSPERRVREIQVWSRSAIEIFGLRLVVTHPRRVLGGPVLLVANHTSWLDVLVLLAITDATLIAKREVRGWPIFGWLSERMDTIFIDRQEAREIEAQISEIEKRLRQGRCIGLFPEGTTTDGETLRPFRPALFEAAVRTGAPVQPIAIRYRDCDGRPLEKTNFTGDMTLLESFDRLAGVQNGVVEIAFLSPVSTASAHRRAVVKVTEAAIQRHLFGDEDEAIPSSSGAIGGRRSQEAVGSHQDVAAEASGLPLSTSSAGFRDDPIAPISA